MTPDTQEAFFNAYTFGFCEKCGFTRGQSWKWSMEEMARTTGCNAIILPVCAWQDHAYSTQIDSVSPDVMDEADVAAVCAHARRLGLRVILKAMVNCRDGYWRAYIRFFDTEVPVEPGWAEWFASWSEHVKRVAAMAEENRAVPLLPFRGGGGGLAGNRPRGAERSRDPLAGKERYHAAPGPLSDQRGDG